MSAVSAVSNERLRVQARQGAAIKKDERSRMQGRKDAAIKVKDVAVNRQAFHNYEILAKFEAGIVLTGTEIKSAREGRVNLKDAYGMVKSGEVWLLNAHINPYSHGNYANHDPLRTRKLLLNRAEINKLIGRTTERGLTLVPLRVYLKDGRLKCELALAKGRKTYDKREVSRQKTIDKETRQAVKERN